MTSEPLYSQVPPAESETVEMPRPTPAPLVLSLGLALLATGAVANVALIFVGAALCLTGLGMWIANLLAGRGHVEEPLVAAGVRAVPIAGAPGMVQHLRAGVPGYRLRLPERVHPISAGIKGGIVGGLVMPLPALAYGMLSGHGIWYPVNLLAGMVLPGMDQMTVQQLEQFQLGQTVVAIVIHAVMAIVLGMVYGVLMPTLPDVPKPLAWGALLAPMLWTGATFLLLGVVNPLLKQGVDWPWFISSQFLFGVVLASVTMLAPGWPPVRAGMVGALVGGILMALHAMLWGHFSGHGIWYPVNLLASMVLSGMGQLSAAELTKFHAEWLVGAIGIHAVITLGIGVLFGVLVPRLPPIPGPLVWGAMLLPLVWSFTTYGMMGVVNPLLAERVNWPWFIVSQLIYGLAAALVVVRCETVRIPPAGMGPDRSPEIVGS